MTVYATQTHTMLNDESDLARQAVTNADAFAELYRLHVTRVYRYHLARAGNAKDAEDLTSQTFMAALEGIRSFRAEGSFAAWIMGIASRKCALFFRGNRRESPLEAALQTADPSVSVEKTVAQKLQLQAIARALRQISADRAEAIALSFFGGLTYAEIGRVLSKSEGAVKMLALRGLQDLRERTSLAFEVER